MLREDLLKVGLRCDEIELMPWGARDFRSWDYARRYRGPKLVFTRTLPTSL